LNWFWNQWYYGNGHPKIRINYNYDDKAGKAQVIIEQTQKTDKVFRLPIAIDMYTGPKKVRSKIWVENKVDTFTFSYTQKPDLINVDADKILLCEKTDNKTSDNYIAQFKYAPNYLDRKEALDYFNKKAMNEMAWGLTDKYAPLRKLTIERLAKSKFAKEENVVKSIEKIVSTEKDKKTLAAAIKFLSETGKADYLPIFNKYVSDSSYTVAGAALEGLNALDTAKSYELAKKYSTDAKGALGEVVNSTLIENGTEADFEFIAKKYNDEPLSQE